jgi:SWI/SNF-related matrix-associated actin-dependent regulator of chromatin subfamily A member 5
LDVSKLAEYDMIVTTYEMAKATSLKGTVWQRQQFNLLVLDEGHRIKCAETQISQAVRKIHSECRIILTGTPLANNLVELWSLLNFLVPDVFTSSTPFAEAFDLTLNVVDRQKLEQAHSVLALFMLRRLKSEVEKLMPKKIETKGTYRVASPVMSQQHGLTNSSSVPFCRGNLPFVKHADLVVQGLSW